MQYICRPVVDVTDEYMAQVCHHAYCVHVEAINGDCPLAFVIAFTVHVLHDNLPYGLLIQGRGGE